MSETTKYQGTYLLTGKLCGRLCDDCAEPLANVTVRIYSPRVERSGEQAVLLEAVANPKDTFAILTEEQQRARERDLLVEVESDEKGRFAAELGPEQRYRGGPVEIHVLCKTVPHRKSTKPVAPVQLALATLQPLWRGDDKPMWTWEHCISERYWCGIRQRFLAWTICGVVVDSVAGAPIAGVEVRAFDADWLQDDGLGTTRTDTTGHFRIDYALEDFHETIFAGLSFEISGPDVYFRVLTDSGAVLLNETQADGRRPGRENRSPCFCARLEVDAKAPPGPGPTVPTVQPLFTHVGQYRVDPSQSDFTAAGLAADPVGELAFASTIPLRGLLPNGDDPRPLEYRFQYAPVSATGAVGAAVDVGADLIAPTEIGQLEYFFWDTSLPIPAWRQRSASVVVKGTAPPISIPQPSGPPLSVPVSVPVEAGGWIAVPRYNEPGPGGRGVFVGGNVVLAALDTTRLTSETIDAISPDAQLAGAPMPSPTSPSSLRTTGKTFRLYFAARNASDLTAIGANELSRITCINAAWRQRRHPSWAGGEPIANPLLLVDIQEIAAAGHGCDRTGGGIHALCTAYHPYLASVSLRIEGNSPPAPVSVPLSNHAAVSPTGGFPFTGLQPCAYILWIDATMNLTAGYGRPQFAYATDHVAFCAG